MSLLSSLLTEGELEVQSGWLETAQMVCDGAGA